MGLIRYGQSLLRDLHTLAPFRRAAPAIVATHAQTRSVVRDASTVRVAHPSSRLRHGRVAKGNRTFIALKAQGNPMDSSELPHVLERSPKDRLQSRSECCRQSELASMFTLARLASHSGTTPTSALCCLVGFALDLTPITLPPSRDILSVPCTKRFASRQHSVIWKVLHCQVNLVGRHRTARLIVCKQNMLPNILCMIDQGLRYRICIVANRA